MVPAEKCHAVSDRWPAADFSRFDRHTESSQERFVQPARHRPAPLGNSLACDGDQPEQLPDSLRTDDTTSFGRCRGSRRAGIDGSLSGPLSLVEGDRRWAGGANLASQPRFSNSGSARWKTPGPTGVSRSILSGRHTPHGADAALLRETLV